MAAVIAVCLPAANETSSNGKGTLLTECVAKAFCLKNERLSLSCWQTRPHSVCNAANAPFLFFVRLLPLLFTPNGSQRSVQIDSGWRSPRGTPFKTTDQCPSDLPCAVILVTGSRSMLIASRIRPFFRSVAMRSVIIVIAHAAAPAQPIEDKPGWTNPCARQ
jgi:hypothetical protein